MFKQNQEKSSSSFLFFILLFKIIDIHSKQIATQSASSLNETATSNRTLNSQVVLNEANKEKTESALELSTINKKGTQYQYHSWKSYYEPKHLQNYLKNSTASLKATNEDLNSIALKLEETTTLKDSNQQNILTNDDSSNVSLNSGISLNNNKENINGIEEQAKKVDENFNFEKMDVVSGESKKLDEEATTAKLNGPAEPAFKMPKNFQKPPKSKFKKHIYQNAIAVYVNILCLFL